MKDLARTVVEGISKVDQLFNLFKRGEISRREYHIAVCNHLDSQAIPCTAPINPATMIKVDLTTMKCIN
jgi:hypothetical protein